MSEKKPDGRIRFTYTIPESERAFETDPHTVTLVPLRVSEEMEAKKLAGASRGGDRDTKEVMELMRRAVVAVDGKPVDWASPLGPEWLEQCSPQVRLRVLRAYNDVHVPKEENDADFFGSRIVEAG